MLASIIAAVGLPFALACVLVAADMRSDLSDLKPARALADGATTLIGWPDLEISDGRGVDVKQAHVRMLGYMMDGYKPSREGERVEMFMLLPEAGQIMHPAHREPSQMVEVWLVRGMPFNYRRLIWVSGVLARVPGQRDPDQAFYAMRDATAEPAVERDITNWFRP